MGKGKAGQGKPLAKQRKKQSPKRRTLHLFDLMAKFILQEASPGAVIYLVNGLFGTAFSLDTPIMFKGTEYVRVRELALEGLRADFIIGVGEREFLLEVQIKDDREMALRLLDYGYAQARRGRYLSPDGRYVVMRLPDPAVIYLEPKERAGSELEPEIIGSMFENPQGDRLEYTAKTYEVLGRNFGEVERLHLHLLLPFYVLLYRQEVKKRGITAEKRRELALKTEAMMNEVETLLQRGNKQGVLTAEDAMMLMERTDQMYEELYGMYAEFQEEHMNVQKRFKTKWQDYLQEREEKGLEIGRQEGESRILGLFRQGYTLEQVEQMLSQEAASGNPQSATT